METGADDYIAKPFSPRELLARLRVALRHSSLPASTSEVVLDGIVVNFKKMEVTRNGASVPLTTGEFRTLRFFVQNPDRIFTPTELLNEVCGAGPNGLAPRNAHRSGFFVLYLELAAENFHSRELHRNRVAHRYVRYRLPGSGGQKQGAALGH